MRERGTVKWFNEALGYGFIRPSKGGGPDVFVHRSAVQGSEPTLEVGVEVEFDARRGPKGLQAVNVTLPQTRKRS